MYRWSQKFPNRVPPSGETKRAHREIKYRSCSIFYFRAPPLSGSPKSSPIVFSRPRTKTYNSLLLSQRITHCNFVGKCNTVLLFRSLLPSQRITPLLVHHVRLVQRYLLVFGLDSLVQRYLIACRDQLTFSETLADHSFCAAFTSSLLAPCPGCNRSKDLSTSHCASFSSRAI